MYFLFKFLLTYRTSFVYETLKVNRDSRDTTLFESDLEKTSYFCIVVEVGRL